MRAPRPFLCKFEGQIKRTDWYLRVVTTASFCCSSDVNWSAKTAEAAAEVAEGRSCKAT